MIESSFDLKPDRLDSQESCQSGERLNKDASKGDAYEPRVQVISEQEIEGSAILYAEIYTEDQELQELAGITTADWPT